MTPQVYGKFLLGSPDFKRLIILMYIIGNTLNVLAKPEKKIKIKTLMNLSFKGSAVDNFAIVGSPYPWVPNLWI
jgi:hypothetical protein